MYASQIVALKIERIESTYICRKLKKIICLVEIYRLYISNHGSWAEHILYVLDITATFTLCVIIIIIKTTTYR